MLQIPVSNVLCGAGWILVLLLLASLGTVRPGAAEPGPVASSVYMEPVGVLHLVQLPDPNPIPTSTPEPSPTPSTTQTPSPTPEPTPEAATPQTASEAVAPPPPPPPLRYPDPDAAAALVTLTNDLRAQRDLPPLAVNAALAAAARAYAETMSANDWFAHEGPDGSTLVSRAEAAGYTGWSYLAENLYRGHYDDPPATIVQAWAASPSHLQAILSAATETGVGCYVSGDYSWCVQEFGAR